MRNRLEALEADIVERLVFDCENQSIVDDGKSVQLSPKAFEVLNLLFANPRQLVTKDELLNTVWPDVCVVDAVLKTVIREIRKTLNDDSRSPRYVETVHRRGYRFIGEKRLLAVQSKIDSGPAAWTKRKIPQDELFLVGRDKELATITDCCNRAQRGIRTGVAIKGDPGIGKSTLMNAWLNDFSSDHKNVLVARTHCIPGNRERPYMPLFDAVDQLCKSSNDSWLCDLLTECAPGLAAQMPWLVCHSKSHKDNNDARQIGPEKFLLEATEFIGRLSQQKVFVWFIDNAHYCDPDTRSLLDRLLHCENRAQLMIVTAHCHWNRYFDDSAMLTSNATWVSNSTTEEIYLDSLNKDAIADYLGQRFSNRSLPGKLANDVCAESGGHPLFVKGIADKLLEEETEQCSRNADGIKKSFANSTMPVPDVISRRMDNEIMTLNADEFRLLQAASVVVVDAFSAAAVAALLNLEIVEIEEQCDELARTNRWIQRLDSRLWPDSTLAQLYGFSNPVYRDYLYQTLPAARKRQLHLRHAERLESAYGAQVTIISNNLAYHFECGGRPNRVMHYNQLTQRNNKSDDDVFNGLKPYYHRNAFAAEFTSHT